MRFILIHKNIETALVECDSGQITSLRTIICEEHMPVGTYKPTMTNEMCYVYLQAWQRGRAIPSDRINLDTVLETSRKDIIELGVLSRGMSLTDHYWLRQENETVTWEDVCFMRNGLQTSLLTLTRKGEAGASPDYVTNGALPKAWGLVNRNFVLLKSPPDWLPTASANEMVAFKLAQLCGVSHVSYFPVKVEDRMVCASPCFLNGDREEFVPLLTYMRTHRGPAAEKAEEMGLSQQFLDDMTAFDLLIGNTDRHEGNFGIIINPDTMAYIRPAPLFDSGTSLHQWYGRDGSFKPFFGTQEEALGNLRNIRIRIPSKEQIRNIVSEAYEAFGVHEYVEPVISELCRNAKRLVAREWN